VKDETTSFGKKYPEMLPLNLTDSISDWNNWQHFGRLVLFPLDRDTVLVRVQNSADKFDMVAPDLTLDMNKFAYDMWNSANPGDDRIMTPNITEVSLSANMEFKEILDRREKMQWRVRDDDRIRAKLESDPEFKAVYETRHNDDPTTAITLVPQAIRAFIIKFWARDKPSFV